MPKLTADSVDEASVPFVPPGEEDAAFQAWRQLFITSQKLQRRCESLLASRNLALSQFEAMIKLGLRPGLSQQDLASALLLTKGNIGALVDRLEGMGMLERRPDPQDRRINRLYLTARGREQVQSGFRNHLAMIHQAMQPLSDAQLKQLRSLLQLVEPG